MSMAPRYIKSNAKGTTPWPPDSMWEPCPDGHSDDQYKDMGGRTCCRRCGDIIPGTTQP